MEYQGGAADDMEKALDEYDRIYHDLMHYGRCIAVVQSSGTGKSRMVQELGLKVCANIYNRSTLQRLLLCTP